MKEDNYEDIINLPHHVSLKHPRLSMEQRAAQFAPFAALTGYDDAIEETARIVDNKIEIDEEIKVILDEKLQIINENIHDKPKLTITYFVEDEKKNGGEYVDVLGIIKKIDKYKCKIILENKTEIPINNILCIEGDFFKKYNFDI